MSQELRQDAMAPASWGARYGRRLWYVGFGLFLMLTILGSATPLPSQSNSPPTPEAVPIPVETTSGTESYEPTHTPEPTMAEALKIVEAALDRYQDVQDYTCEMVKRERLGDRLPPEETIVLSVRKEPFSVDLRWLEPRSLAGQEAVYVAGRNNGCMRVRSAGLLGAVGFISLDPNGERAKSSSRHGITEAGVGNLIDRFCVGWKGECVDGLTEVHIAPYDFDAHHCMRVETIHDKNPDHRYLFHRTVVYFDDASKLPLRVENYGYPRTPGGPELLEEQYSYLNMRINVGLTDALFNK